MKGLKEENLRYFGYLLILFLFSCKACKQPFEPNPNLRLLLRILLEKILKNNKIRITGVENTEMRFMEYIEKKDGREVPLWALGLFNVSFTRLFFLSTSIFTENMINFDPNIGG